MKPVITGHELTEQGGITLHWSIEGATNPYVVVYRNGIAVSSAFIGDSWTDTSPRSDVPNQYSIYVTTQALRPENVWSSTYVVDTSRTYTMQTPCSDDPNEIIGPIGYDFDGYNAGTEENPYFAITTPNWITDNRDQTITIYFENKPTATAAAREVFVSMQMPEEWDWNTFMLYEIFIGNQIYTQVAGSSNGTWYLQQASTGEQIQLTVTFDAATGYAHWYLRSYVTDTPNHFPASIYDGFLPPNDNTHRGEGFISFGVRMKDGLDTGTVVESFASIIFDANEEILTNVWKNTIDSTAPTSRVLPLAEISKRNRFLVEWEGTDVGSGIAHYDVYVSIDGGAFEIWQKRTTEISAYFEGENGKTYAFYSIATDNVGLIETTPKLAEATTTVQVGFDGEIVTQTVTMPNTGTANQWTVRQNGNNIEIVDAANKVVFTQLITSFNHLVINSSGTTNDELTIDFSQSGVLLEYGIVFNGSNNHTESLTLIGSDGDDVWQINIDVSDRYYGGLPIFITNVDYVTIDGKDGHDQIWMDGSDGNDVFTFTRGITEFSTSATNFETVNVEEVFVNAQGGVDMATVFSTDSNNTFSMSDNFFVMVGGGYRLELCNFSMIDAIASGRKDKTFVYGENNSLIVMNDMTVERRATGQTYRIWYSEQVTAINMDDTNNAILHTGSRGYDTYTMAAGYGTATNAVGSYYHEFIDFKNINISTPTSVSTVHLPTGNGWQVDSNTWSQSGFNVTVMGNANIVTRDKSPLPMQAAASFAEIPVTEMQDRCCGTASPLSVTVAATSAMVMQPTALETAIQPTALEMVSQPEAILQSKAVVKSDAVPHAEKRESVFTHNHFEHTRWDDNLFAFLANEQMRLHKKKDKWFGDDEDDNWLAEFEKLALLELRK